MPRRQDPNFKALQQHVQEVRIKLQTRAEEQPKLLQGTVQGNRHAGPAQAVMINNIKHSKE
jgi:hypothetical protein